MSTLIKRNGRDVAISKVEELQDGDAINASLYKITQVYIGKNQEGEMFFAHLIETESSRRGFISRYRPGEFALDEQRGVILLDTAKTMPRATGYEFNSPEFILIKHVVDRVQK